ncbi:hypothetical protein Q3G72_029524 [Acer saccharum]|nr:hypothetical protein Q3G72_029524 [Acer saccharum]
MQAKQRDDKKNARLSDVCTGTSAAPYYLPPYYFEFKASNYNLVDGGTCCRLAADNRPLYACEVTKEMCQESQDTNSQCLKTMVYSKLLVLSLGTGSSKRDSQYEVGDGKNELLRKN